MLKSTKKPLKMADQEKKVFKEKAYENKILL